MCPHPHTHGQGSSICVKTVHLHPQDSCLPPGFFLEPQCAVLSLVARSCPTLCDPMDCSPPGCPRGFSRQESWSGLPCPAPGDLLDPAIEPRSPALQADSLPAKPPGKPRSTGVGSLSLLQWIFPTQDSNQGLLHCRWILYLWSYQGRPNLSVAVVYSSKIHDGLWQLPSLHKF